MFKLTKIAVASIGLPLVLTLTMGVQAASVSKKDVLEHYADIAHAMYGDSVTTAQTLKKAVDAFIAKPTQLLRIKA